MNSESLTDPLRETLAIFERAGEPRTTPEVADHLDLGRRSTYARLERLVEAGRLETKKAGANARVWWRPLPRSDPLANDGRLQDSTVDGLEGCIDNGSDAGADGSDAGADGSDSGADGHDADTGPTRHGRVRREPGHEFERLVDAVDEYAIFTLDADGSVRTWNPGVERIKGYTEDEIVGEHVSIFYTEEDRVDGVPQRNLDEATHHGSVETEGWRVRADGSLFWANVTISAIRDDDGSLGGYAKVTRDMTERREYERRLESQAERLEYQLEDLESELDEVFERISDGFYALDEDLRFLYLNDHAAEILGLEGPVLGQKFLDLVTLTDAFERAVHEAVEGGEPVIFEDYYDPADRWFYNAIYPSETGLSVYFRDVTERKEREHELGRYETTIETVWDGVTMIDAEERFVMVNEAFCELTGYSREEIIGEHVSLVLDGQTYETAARWYESIERGELDIATLEHDLQTADGGAVPVEARFGTCEFEDGTVGASGVIRDVTDRKRRTKELERFKVVVEEIRDVTAILDATGTIQYVSPSVETEIGHDPGDILGENPFEYVHPEDRDRVLETFAELVDDPAREPTAEYRFRREDGSYAVLETRARNLLDDPNIEGIVVYSREITDRVERERTLQRQRNQLATLFEILPVGVVVADADGRLVESNERAKEIWGGNVFDAETIDEYAKFPAAWADTGSPVEPNEWTMSRVLDGDEVTSPDVFEIETVDGGRRIIESSGMPVRDERGAVRRGVVTIRDVTERRERQRKLAENEQRYRTLVDNIPDGAVVLFDDDFRYTTAGGELLDQIDVTPDELAGQTIYERYSADLVDAIEPHFLATLDGERRSVTVENHGRELALRILPVGDAVDFSGMLMVQDVTEQNTQERRLRRQREQLAALNDINEVASEITTAVIDQSTREEIEQTVCDALAAADAYEFAWLAGIDPTTNTFEPRAEAGTRGYMDDVTISIDPADSTGDGPGATAIRERETRVVQDVFSDPRFEPWREAAAEYGFNAVAAIPITHDRTVYGVLGVYADRENAFDDAERTIVSRLGEVVGHAIAATERKRALMSDELVELEFLIQDGLSVIDDPIEMEGSIVLEETVHVGDDEFLVYATATGDGLDAASALVDTLPHWEEFTVVSAGDPATIELRLVDPPVLSVVTAMGGYIDDVVIADGDYRMTIHLAPTAEVRHVIDTIEATYPSVEMVRRKQISRSSDDPHRVRRQYMEELTARQRAALDAAYHAGYFEWPRQTSGESLAESLDVSPPTYHQHLRTAEGKVLDALYTTMTEGDE